MTAVDEQSGLAAKLGFTAGQVVQETGHGEDSDQELRASIAALTGKDLVDEDYDDSPDAVILWFRDGDGDLTNTLVRDIGPLADGGMLWLLTPKVGREGYLEGYLEPSEIAETANTAGLTVTKSTSATADWAGARIVQPKAA
ncbi:DUF3052 domain-containing protein [Streptomyces anulatus]|uniref:DUF3052 domain-containing protein n=1 Tax=Streptomyces anulatus TaxID=1892 RepID=UPI0038690118|nr:DUF3052 domain-containing protein [Streptomyces anulatus]